MWDSAMHDAETLLHSRCSTDPCEYTDLASKMPDVVTKLATRLKDFSATAVPPVAPDGCQPVKIAIPGSTEMAWAPCDHP